MTQTTNKTQIYVVQTDSKRRHKFLTFLAKQRLTKEERLYINLTEVKDWKYYLFPEELKTFRKKFYV